MKFLERVLSKKEVDPISTLHADFRHHQDGWYFNDFNLNGMQPSLKVIFKFEDPQLLNECPFMAKIGLNQSDGEKYFGVAFGDDLNRGELEAWAQRFTWAHLLIGLDFNGEMTEETEELDLKSF